MQATGLYHEVLDHPVENNAVVESLFNQFPEVACGYWHFLLKEFYLYVSHVGL